MIRRREFITLVGGAAAAWPIAARAQQGERVRHLAAMMGGRNADTDPEGRIWFAAFRQGLQELFLDLAAVCEEAADNIEDRRTGG